MEYFDVFKHLVKRLFKQDKKKRKTSIGMIESNACNRENSNFQQVIEFLPGFWGI